MLMKPSGVQWLGDIPSDWNVIPIKYWFTIGNGSNPSTDVGPTPVYGSGSKSFKTCMESKEGPAVLLGRKGTVNIPQWIEGNYWNVDTAFDVKVKPGNNVLLKYLYYCATCFDYDFYTTKTSLPSMTQNTYYNYKIPFINVAEQHAIVSYLDDRCSKLDEIITEAEKSIEEYKELKQAVIFEAVTKGLDKNVPMKDSGVEWIGSIPTSWKTTILRRFCSFQTGKTPSTSVPEWFDGDVNWFTPGDFNDDYYLLDSRRKLSENALNDSAAISIKENCVMIVGIGGSAGKVGITKVPCSCNQQITAVISADMDSKYLMYYLELDGKYLKDTAMFTTLPILNNDTLGNSPLIVPEVEEQREIANHLDNKLVSINSLIQEKHTLVEDLQTYKKSLIYEVVTGKKRVVI